MDIYILLEGEERNSLPHDEAARVIMGNDELKKYVHRHGWHFTNALADEASRMMDGITWTSREVANAIEPMLERNRNKFTNGDLTYIANMARTDFVPELLKNDVDALKCAVVMANDSDGYEGMPMMRWISDLVGKHITDIDWGVYD